jgi:hypothetical protein
MHRTLALASTLALSRATCVTDADCSLNGVCTGGSCLCDDGWTTYPSLKLDGPDCGQLDLLPAASDTSFHGLDTNKSSWGGSVLHLPTATDGVGGGGGKKKWTMFAAEMTRGCTLRHWTTNSEVVMATADDPQGPYTEAFQIIPPWAHNPEAILTPGGEVVVFTLGDGKPVHGPEFPCDAAPGAPTPAPLPPRAPTPAPTPGSAVHNVSMLLHHAAVGSVGDASAWAAHNATLVDFPVAFQWEGNWNPAPVALPDGRVRVMAHTGFSGYFNELVGWSGEVVIEAPSWEGPYRLVSSRDVTNCTHCEEDPFMWQDHRGNWHVIYHRMFDNGTDCNGYPDGGPGGVPPAKPCKAPEGRWSMGHSFSPDGLVWSSISRCANTTAQLLGGGSITFTSRERPKLVMGDDGRPAFLSNAVQPFQDGAGADAGVTHTLVVPLNVKQNREQQQQQ